MSHEHSHDHGHDHGHAYGHDDARDRAHGHEHSHEHGDDGCSAHEHSHGEDVGQRGAAAAARHVATRTKERSAVSQGKQARVRSRRGLHAPLSGGAAAHVHGPNCAHDHAHGHQAPSQRKGKKAAAASHGHSHEHQHGPNCNHGPAPAPVRQPDGHSHAHGANCNHEHAHDEDIDLSIVQWGADVPESVPLVERGNLLASRAAPTFQDWVDRTRELWRIARLLLDGPAADPAMALGFFAEAIATGAMRYVWLGLPTAYWAVTVPKMVATASPDYNRLHYAVYRSWSEPDLLVLLERQDRAAVAARRRAELMADLDAASREPFVDGARHSRLVSWLALASADHIDGPSRLALLQGSVRMDPTNAEASYQVGRHFFLEGDHVQAAAALQAAIKVMPSESPEAMRVLAMLLMAMDRNSATAAVMLVGVAFKLRQLELKYADSVFAMAKLAPMEQRQWSALVIKTVHGKLRALQRCFWCLGPQGSALCSQCGAVAYCSKEHQKAAWVGDGSFAAHKASCVKK